MFTLSEHTQSKLKGTITTIVVAVTCLLAALFLSGCSCSEADAQIGKLSVQVNAENYNPDTSTPVEIAVYAGDVKDLLTDEDESNNPMSITTFTADANTACIIEEITNQGTYTIEIKATPVYSDGTLFSLPEIQVIEVGTEDTNANFDLTPLDLETASAEEVEEVTNKATEAASESGDEAKTQTAATGVAAAASKSKSSATTSTNTSSNKTSNATTSSTSNKSSASTSSSSANKSSSSSASTNNNSSSASSSTSSSNKSSSSNSSNTTTKKKAVWVCKCGHVSYSVDESSAHLEERALAGDYNHNSSVRYM